MVMPNSEILTRQCLRESLNNHEECPQCRVKANSGHIVKNVALESVLLVYDRARADILSLIAATRRQDESPRKGSKRKRDTSPDSDIEMIGGPLSESSRPSASHTSEVEMVECPQCTALVELVDINAHLDNSCETPPTAPSRKKAKTSHGKQAWKNIFDSTSIVTKKSQPSKTGNANGTPGSSPLERLPKEAYDTLKEKQIRVRLQRFDLPTTGSRSKLQARHERWVVIFNANLDQSPEHQRSLSALRTQLQIWEQGRERDEKERTKAQEKVGANGSIAADYEVKHQAQFKSLVEQARASKPRTVLPALPTEPDITRDPVEDWL
ncbi:E3 ubiquitin-protein ligase rad18 [Tulasnella sp. 403]|nr:E3 ubiquitin-protein ligase rad18 [Tulasnella sp. 403]